MRARTTLIDQRFMRNLGRVLFSLYVLAALVFIFLMASQASAARLHKESVYQAFWCNKMGGQIEYVLPDKSRVDCITSTHAIEVDFANKWAEAVGQSLFYSAATGKKAGVLLIIEDEDRDLRYIDRLAGAIASQCLNIKVWFIYPEEIIVAGVRQGRFNPFTSLQYKRLSELQLVKTEQGVLPSLPSFVVAAGAAQVADKESEVHRGYQQQERPNRDCHTQAL